MGECGKVRSIVVYYKLVEYQVCGRVLNDCGFEFSFWFYFNFFVIYSQLELSCLDLDLLMYSQ